MLLQVNRLAGLAVMLHCILPSALGLPPLLATPSVTRALHATLDTGFDTKNALAVITWGERHCEHGAFHKHGS